MADELFCVGCRRTLPALVVNHDIATAYALCQRCIDEVHEREAAAVALPEETPHA